MVSKRSKKGPRRAGINPSDPGSFLFLMTRAVRHWRRQLDLELKHYLLTEATCRPLMYIDRMGDGVRQKDLAYEMEIEGSSLVRLLDSLQKGGLIKRRPEPGDRRANNLYLTPSGREMVGHVRRITDSLHKRVLDQLSPKDEAACYRTFEELENAFFVVEDNEAAAEGSDAAPAPVKTTPSRRARSHG